MPKRKRPWRQVSISHLCSRPPLMQGLRVLIWMWIIWKISAIILFKRNMAEQDVCHAHMFHFLNCNFSFCADFLHHWWFKGKKRINKALFKHSKQFLLLFFFFFWFKELSFKTQFSAWINSVSARINHCKHAYLIYTFQESITYVWKYNKNCTPKVNFWCNQNVVGKPYDELMFFGWSVSINDFHYYKS